MVTYLSDEWLERAGAALAANGELAERTAETDLTIGYVVTGATHSPAAGARARLPLETSVPLVFAIGDVRAGSTKRVAAAVGEGAAVVAQIHAALAVAP